MALLLLLLCVFAATASEPAFPAKEMLFAHNAIRSRVGLPPLRWSDSLAKFAQDWANTLLARKQFSHRPKSPYGENLFEIRAPRQVPMKWSGIGAPKRRITTIGRTAVTGDADTIRRSSGAIPFRSVARWRGAGGSKSGSATMTRPATMLASALTEFFHESCDKMMP